MFQLFLHSKFPLSPKSPPTAWIVGVCLLALNPRADTKCIMLALPMALPPTPGSTTAIPRPIRGYRWEMVIIVAGLADC